MQRLWTMCWLSWLFAATGCCAPLIPSQRFAGAEAGCECTSVLDHTTHFLRQPHAALPGSDRVLRGPVPMELQQEALQPPHSKFHPVPTRPVFAPRPEQSPPEPIGMGLKPVREPQSVPPDRAIPPRGQGPRDWFRDSSAPHRAPRAVRAR